MALRKFVHFLLATDVVAAPFLLLDRRADPPLVPITDTIFGDLTLVEQYSAAAYCTANVITANVTVECSSGNCPVVEGVNARILTPILTPKNTNNIVTGYVADDSKNDIFVVSFRGTQSKTDLFKDINYQLVPTLICPKCEASYGLNKAWNEVKAPILAAIKAGGQRKRVLVTGHSLGGAIASVAAADLRSMGYVADMYTFGAPRFANKALADYVQQTSPKQGVNFRVTHYNDPVPALPMTFMGQTDIFPEYYISAPTNQSVAIKDLAVLESSDASKGNAGQMPKEVSAHGWYFNAISACANGTWLEGGLPTPIDYTGDALSWMESTAWTLTDKLFGAGNTALNVTLGLFGMPQNVTIPSPTTAIPKDGLTQLTSWLSKQWGA